MSLHDLTLERYVLGSCLLKPELFSAHKLSPEDFWSESNASIWRAFQRLYLATKPINTVTLRVQLIEERALERVGGDDYLLSLTDTIPPMELPVERLRKLAHLRRTRESLCLALERCERGDAEGVMAEITRVHEETGRRGHRILNFGELLQAGLESTCAPAGGRIHLGMERVRRAIGYIPPGAPVLIAAGPGVGKSSVLLEMAMASARSDPPLPCGIISLEDGAELTGGRALAAESGVSSKRLQRGAIQDDEWAKLSEACTRGGKIGDCVLFSDVTGGTELDVVATMSEMARRGARWVAVDYIGKVRCSERGLDPRNATNTVLSAIETAAKRLGIVPVIVSQLARPDGRNPNAKPSKHHLKESGELENSARVLILLWREQEDDFAPINVEISKCTWGGTGQRWVVIRSREDVGNGYGSARLIEQSYTPPAVPDQPYAKRRSTAVAAPGTRIISMADYRSPKEPEPFVGHGPFAQSTSGSNQQHAENDPEART